MGKIRIKTWDGKEDYYLPFNEETYSAGVYSNPEFDTDVIRYSYNSMTTPNSVIDFNMKNQTKEIKKEQEVLGGSSIKIITKVNEYGLQPEMEKRLLFL